MFIDFEKMKTVNGRSTGEKNKVYKNMSKQLYPSLDNKSQHSTFNSKLEGEFQKVQLEKDIENYENLVFYTINGDVNSKPMNENAENAENDENTENEDSEEHDEQLQLNVNYSTHMYVGSITVVGLFVFYRMLQKTK
jgi:hypothetical protein